MRIKFFFVVAVLATAILCFGATSVRAVDNSALIAQLIAQIQALQAQLQTLQAQQGVTPTWCHTFNTNLGFANSGSDEVGALHTVLDKEGNSYAPDTGNTYDEGTAHAVIQLQAKYGILQSGYVGPITRAKLNSLYGCAPTPPVACLNGSGPLLPGQSYCNSTQPSITVTSPNGGENWQVGSTQNITWTSSGVSNVMIELDKNSPNSGWHLTYSVPASSGLFRWTIPSSISESIASASDYSIKIWDTTNPSITDSSNNYFTITAPTTTCADSDGGTNYNIRGTTTGLNIYNEATTSTDYCVYAGQQGTYGQYLQLGQQAVIEYACNSNGKTVYDDLHICPNGCSNGACLQTVQPSITITSPNGGENWVQGSTHNITWTANGVDLVAINLLKQSSGTAATVITSSPVSASTGSYSWTIPSTLTTGGDYYLQLWGRNGSGATAVTLPVKSSNSFTIATAYTACTYGQTMACNAGYGAGVQTCVNGQWGSCIVTQTQPSISSIKHEQVSTGDKITISGANLSGATSVGFYLSGQTEAVASIGASSLTTSSNSIVFMNLQNLSSKLPIGTNNVYIIVVTPAGSSNTLLFSQYVVTPQPTITVTSPTGTSPITIKSIQNITWTTSGAKASYVSIGLYGQAGNFLGNITTQTANTGSYSWTIPSTVTNGTYRIRVSEYGNAAVYGESGDLVFAIPVISPVFPVAGNNFVRGSTQNITWTTSGIDVVPYVRIDLYLSGTFIQTLTSKVANTGSYSWIIPTSLSASDKYTIKISSFTDGVIRGDTGSFNITVAVSAADFSQNNLASLFSAFAKLLFGK